MSKALSVSIGKALNEAVYWVKNYRFARVEDTLPVAAIAELSGEARLLAREVFEAPRVLVEAGPELDHTYFDPELVIPPEGMMPLEFPPITFPSAVAAEARKPVRAALSHEKAPGLPAPAQSKSAEPAPTDKAPLKNLLFVLEAHDMKVQEVRPLSGGTTKITLDDLVSMKPARERELVLVRR